MTPETLTAADIEEWTAAARKLNPNADVKLLAVSDFLALLSLAASALEARWVACSERCPDDDIEVLGCRGDYFFVCSYQEDDDAEDGGGIWFDDNGGGLGAIEQPTHWMPLPPPPPPPPGKDGET